MLDIPNPFGFIAELYRTKALEKWFKLAVSCALAAFIAFWGTMGITGMAVLSSTNSPLFALASGFFAGCLLMAAAVLLTVRKSPAWKDLTIVLPEQLQEAVESSDVVPPPKATQEQ